MRRFISIVLCAVIMILFFASCGMRDADLESSGGDVTSPPGPSEGESRADNAGAENVLRLLEAYLSGYESPVKDIELLDVKSIAGDSWYKIRVVKEFETAIYMVTEDCSRIYIEIGTGNDHFQIPMLEAYRPYDEPNTVISDEEKSALAELLFHKMVMDMGEDVTGHHDNIRIVNDEFCFMMTASYDKDRESTHLGTYAISLDGERFYKLGEDSYFYLMEP